MLQPMDGQGPANSRARALPMLSAVYELRSGAFRRICLTDLGWFACQTSTPHWLQRSEGCCLKYSGWACCLTTAPSPARQACAA